MARVLPMKATAGPIPDGDDWIYEVKWDGMRAVVRIDDGAVRITTANGNDATRSFPELAGLASSLGVSSAVLDGEIVALDPEGRPDFGLLQNRMHVRNERAAAERATTVPTTLLLFDLLELDGNPTIGLPWEQRRRLLESLVEPGPHWQLSGIHDDGAALFEAATERGLEGIVAKRRSSRYVPGGRTKEWRKIKVRRRQEFVIGGVATGSGRLEGDIGSLLVGLHEHEGGPLRYAGRVGSGLSRALAREIADEVAGRRRASSPFEPPPPAFDLTGATYVDPIVVVEVAFAEWTGDGRLRHPSVCGRRYDVDPTAVIDSG